MDTIEIKTSENTDSKIIIQEDLRNDLNSYLEDKRYFLITNTKIKKLYSKILNNFDKNNTIVIKDGEKYKNLQTYEYICSELLKRKIERGDGIIALGGGVVGDIAGFCASTILRGVDLIQVPTTLLAMCDSSIGGKTGVDSKYGKNLIGSFYLASKVLIDPNFIHTLNEYEYKCGFGEILKYAFIEKSCMCDTNYDLLDLFEKNQTSYIANNMPYIIKACAHLKATVVQKDKLEGGLRKILNFGHTYAHSAETLSNYKRISHGEAVAWGMKCAAQTGYRLNITDKIYLDKINFIIDKYKIIKHKFNYKKSDIITLMKQDKKVTKGKINLLIPVAEGKVELLDNIDLHELEASLP